MLPSYTHVNPLLRAHRIAAQAGNFAKFSAAHTSLARFSAIARRYGHTPFFPAASLNDWHAATV